ncbi:MAG: hypothetical protein IJ770_02000, partial [Alphaproteobacteria bacterium]|nr:hypothetical protein [Alphaproteobacteria bacterium]
VAEFKQAMKKLTANEKDAVVIGLRDELTNRLGSAYNENVTNKKFLVDNVRQKIKAAIGEKSIYYYFSKYGENCFRNVIY